VIRERELGIRATPAPLESPAKAKRATKKDDAKTEVVDDAPVAEDAADEATVEAEPAVKAPKATKAKEAK
jgi:large subunit ribosomal protein L29